MWVKRLVISILLLICLPVLGIGGGYAALELWNKADRDHWQALGRPPSVPIEFVDGDTALVYVSGQDGLLYECDTDGPTRDNACWRAVGEPQLRDPYVEREFSFSGEIPSPPGRVVETLDLAWHAAERSNYARYVILDDGTVWQWDYHGDANWSIALLTMGAICGLVVAVLVIVVIWLVAGVRALARKAREAGSP